MSQTNLKFYQISAKNFARSGINWKQLAKVDSKLTRQWLDCKGFCSHKNVAEESDCLESDDENAVHGFLDGEYGKSMLSVEYKEVSYIPSDSFKQLGLFAKGDFNKGSVINGVIGFLAEIRDDEIVAGYNDVSILYSSFKKMQWIMLGPISFINASCRANIEYKQNGKIVICVAKKNIKCGEELTVFYNTHYFGRFNKDCLCPHKIEHSDPCPKDPEPARKKRIIERENLSTPQNAISKKPEMVQTPVRRIVIEKLPPRRVLYAPVLSNANEQSEKSLSYESVFDEIDLSLSPIKHSTPLAQRLDQSFSSNGVEPVETSSLNSSIHSLVNLSSTPVRLDLLETEVDIPYFEPVKVSLFQEEGTPLFEGSRASTESFFKEFNSLCDTHKFSKAARHDVLKLFSKSLPVPNNLHVKLALPSLPTISLIESTDAHFCCVDIKTQMERILIRNAQYVLRSWENNCTWSTAWDHFRQPEVQLVLNADGAPVFKSSKLAVWPIWVQIFNLPPKLRAAFSNLSLLGIWYGKSKPDFSKLLPRI